MKKRWPLYSTGVYDKLSYAVKNNQHVEFVDNRWVTDSEDRVRTLFRRRYAIAVNSGTTGLLAAYHALGLSAGASVLAPAYTFYATATSMLPLRLNPVLADFEKETLNVSVDTLEQSHDTAVEAIVVTHNWGNAITSEQLAAIKERFSLPLIDDCSHMFGSPPDSEFYNSPRVSDISVVSAGARKIISGGAGGFVLTDDASLYDRLLAICQPKRSGLYVDPRLNAELGYVTSGMNGRMNILSAILIDDQLEQIEAIRRAWLRVVKEVVEQVRQLDGFRVPLHNERETCWYKIPVITPGSAPVYAEALRARVADLGVGVDPAVKPFFTFAQYARPQPISAFANYASLQDRIQILDVSEAVARRYLCE